VKKWTNQDGVELNIGEMTEVGKVGSSMNVVQDVVKQCIKILSTYRIDSPQSMGWALNDAKQFLKINFDIKDVKKGSTDE